MRKVIKLVIIIALLILISIPSFATSPYGLAYDYILANRPELISQYSYWIFGQNQGIGFNNMTDIEHRYFSGYSTASIVRPKANVGALWVTGNSASVLTSANWNQYMEAELNPNSPIGYKMIYTNVAITHQHSGFTTTPIDLFYDPYDGYTEHFTTTAQNQILSYKNNTTDSLTIELWSNGQSNVSINSPSRWTGTQDIGSSKIPFKIEPNETFIVKRNSGDLINIGVKEYNGESYVYDENSTINILSPNDNSKTVNPNEYITYRVKYSKFHLGTKVLMRRNDGIAVEPIAAVVIADNSTLTEFDKTYKLAIRLVANQNNKVEIFTRSLFNKVTGIKAVNIIHKSFVDANQDGVDDESNQIQYGGSSVPLTEEPLNWADAAFNHGDYSMGEDGIPDVSAIAGKLVASTGQLSYLVTSLFTFLPPDLIAIIVFGIGLAILLRIVGR